MTLLLYESAIPRLTAHRIIRNQQENSHLEPEDVYNLWLIAHQDKDLAGKMSAMAAMRKAGS